MTAWYGKNDEHALVAIARGELTGNPDTGHVDYRGRPVGVAQPTGYITVSIRRYGGHGWVHIGAHRIMWMLHVGTIPAGMVVNHRNSRRWDNRLANLDLTTRAGNGKHAAAMPYGAVGNHQDDNCVDIEWLAKVRTLAESGDATEEQVQALMPATDKRVLVYYGGAELWRSQRGRRGEAYRVG